LSADKKLGNLNLQEFNSLTGTMTRFENSWAESEVILPHPDKVKHLLHSPKKSFSGTSFDRILKRAGDAVYRIEKGRIFGFFTCRGRKK